MNTNDLKEKALFFAVTTGLFLPARIIFYNFVSTWWVGSFGLISIIMILMLYLTKKEKLGFVGRIWKKQIIKISQGKLGIIAIVQCIVLISVFSYIVYITDINRNTEETNQAQMILKQDGIDGLDDLYNADNLLLLTPENIIETVHFFIEHPEIIGVMYAIIDDFSYGFHQHFNIVWLVEEIEALGFLLYFRYFYKQTPNIKDKHWHVN